MKLSIIIPVYNVENYVERCLLSCISQDVSHNDYEIIVINDGSTDASLSIIKDIAREYDNIQVYTQSNAGLSVARNVGLNYAKGEFVWFVDSDDWIELNCLGRLFDKLKTHIDICQLNHRLVYDDVSKNLDINNVPFNGELSGKEVFKLFGGLPAPAPFCIFRRKFLHDNNLSFVPGILHEDIEFKPRTVFFADAIVSDDNISYNYYQRSIGSITSSFSMKRVNSYIVVNNSLYNFFITKNTFVKSICTSISINLNAIFRGYWLLNIDERRYARKSLKENRHLFKCMLKTNKFKYIIEGSIFLLNINIGLFIFRILNH